MGPSAHANSARRGADAVNEYVEEELQDARDALSDAEKMRQAGVTDEALVNRLYYACFHVVNAVLASKDVEVTSHRGLVAMFGKEVVNNGDASAEEGRFLNTMQMYRQTADYEHKPVQADVDELFERTKAFVAAMEALT